MYEYMNDKMKNDSPVCQSLIKCAEKQEKQDHAGAEIYNQNLSI